MLRAFERTSRRDFVGSAFDEAVARDLEIPIGCGQTIQPAWLIARMVEALDVRPQHRVLEVGSGSGYAAVILAQLAAEVLGVERFRTLAVEAQARLAELAIVNAAIVWADGLGLQGNGVGRFDRVLVHGLLDAPAVFLPLMNPGGMIVCARVAEYGPAIVHFAETAGTLAERVVCPARLQPLRRGLRGTV